MLPVRNLRFDLPAERIKDWNEHGPEVTLFFNALSLLFPAGERFFMDSVRHYRKQIDDPQLAAEISGFIGQEAMHSREHISYNERMEAAGLPANALHRFLTRFLDLLKTRMPAPCNLAVTVALEHHTAILADLLLSDSRYLGETSKPGYVQVWIWHALEETEHKAVSYDVWNRVLKPGPLRYLLRTSSMLLTTLVFFVVTFCFHVRLLIANRGANSWRGLWRLIRFLYGPGGMITRAFRPWLDFFRPGFHPWQHDNREHLQRIDGLVAALYARQGS